MSIQRVVNEKCRYLFAFIIPVLVAAGVMMYLGIVPFGDKSVFIWDAKLQYKDFYGYLWDVLHGNASIEYSMGKSLGGKMMGIIGYYVSSPLNLLLVFFTKSQLPLFMSIVTVLRIGLCGVTSCYYITKRFGISFTLSLLFSTAYALMEYNIYYCRNIMWLDGVIMLPLIALGVWRVINEKKKVLLWFSVALAIIANWYTGYMVCLMSGIYFLYEYCIYQDYHLIKTIKDDWKIIINYLITMLLGVMTSLVILLPACMALIGGKATHNTIGLSGIIHFDILHFFSGYEIGAQVNNQMAPVIFCSGFVLISCFYYFFCPYIRKKEKIVTGLFSLFLVLSFCMQDLEMLWTAFVKSSSYAFRFSFVVPFFMLVIAVQAWINIQKNGINKKAMCYGILLLLVIFYILYRGGELHTYKRILILYMLFLALTGVVCIYSVFSNIKIRRFAMLSLFLMLVVELSYNTTKAFGDYQDSSNLFSNYVKDMESVVEKLNTLSEGEFFRFEKNVSYLTLDNPKTKVATCESLLFNYNSIEHYSSAYDEKVDSFLAKVGYADLASNEKFFRTESYWNSPMVLMDSLLSIKYAILPSETYGYKKLDLDERVPFEDEAVYENQFVLPLAYNVSNDFGEIFFGADPFQNQENILQKMTGKKVDVYKNLPQKMTDFSRDSEMWNLTATTNGPVYLYINSSETHNNLYSDRVNNCSVYVNGYYLQDSCVRMSMNGMYLGNYKAGDRIQLKIRHNSKVEKEHRLYAVQLDQTQFKETMNLLHSGYDCDLHIDGNKILGKYTTESDSKVFLSIPYEESWTVYVDGEEVEYDKLADTFLGVDLKKGTHEIEMVYKTPGLRMGALLSVVGVVLFIIYNFVTRKSRFVPVDKQIKAC